MNGGEIKFGSFYYVEILNQKYLELSILVNQQYQDIDYIKSKYITNSKNTYRRLSEEYINISLGIDEMIKNSWKIIDDNRTNVKSRLKAMSVIKECYKYKTEMLGTERTLNQMNNLYQQMLVKEKDLTKRENALKAFLEGRKLTEDEIYRETNPIEYSNLLFF